MSDLRKRIGESLRTSGPLWTVSLALERALPLNVLGRWPGRTVPVERLREQVLAILAAWGMPEEEASITAGHLLYADLCGIDSHGVGMLLHYQRALREGAVRIPAEIRVVTEGEGSALLDGGGGLGHLPADRAMRMAIAKARETGTAAVAVRNSGHFGAAGSYAAMAAEAGVLGIAMTSTGQPAVIPTFGAEPMLGTNALAFAAPSATGRGFLLDMATSAASLGKAWTAWREGRRIPAGWAVDRRGKPIRNGRVAAQQRRLSPLGSVPETSSHKGYGLAAMVEILCAALPGPAGRDHAIGHFFVAIDPASFREHGNAEEDFDALTDSLRAGRPLDPSRPVMVAGDPEREAREWRLHAGIPLSRSVLEDLRAVARGCGVPFEL
jgi:LDH2 family malate/lactate/ureidoglycolate dehydrogenase